MVKGKNKSPGGHDAHPSIAVNTLHAISQYIKVLLPFARRRATPPPKYKNLWLLLKKGNS